MGTPLFADQIFIKYIREILERGAIADPQMVRPHYSDGVVANFKYITDAYMKFDLAKGEFPISSLRPIAISKAIQEIFWIWQDQTSDLAKLEERGVMWWRPWALEDNSIGERYGKTVSNYDIVNRTLEGLRKNPYNRRSIMSLWQYADLDSPAKLPPCAFQMAFDVRKIGEETFLDANLFQRSSDFLVAGLGINQMQYAALQMMFAKHLGFSIGTFSWHAMNLHIYDRHFEQAQELITRFENYGDFNLDNSHLNFTLDCPSGTDFYSITPAQFELTGYNPITPQLKFDLAE